MPEDLKNAFPTVLFCPLCEQRCLMAETYCIHFADEIRKACERKSGGVRTARRLPAPAKKKFRY